MSQSDTAPNEDLSGLQSKFRSFSSPLQSTHKAEGGFTQQQHGQGIVFKNHEIKPAAIISISEMLLSNTTHPCHPALVTWLLCGTTAPMCNTESTSSADKTALQGEERQIKSFTEEIKSNGSAKNLSKAG